MSANYQHPTSKVYKVDFTFWQKYMLLRFWWKNHFTFLAIKHDFAVLAEKHDMRFWGRGDVQLWLETCFYCFDGKKKTFFTVWQENMILWFWRKNMISKFRWENIIFIFWFKFFNFFSTSEPLIFRSSRRSCPNRLRPSNFGFSGFSIVRQFSFGSNIVRQFGKYVRVIIFFVCYKPCDC